MLQIKWYGLMPPVVVTVMAPVFPPLHKTLLATATGVGALLVVMFVVADAVQPVAGLVAVTV